MEKINAAIAQVLRITVSHKSTRSNAVEW